MDTVNILAVTDIHLGDDPSKDGKIREALGQIVDIAHTRSAHGLLELGDRVTSKGTANDILYTTQVKAAFAAVRAPVQVFHATGNHDVKVLPRQRVEEIMECPAGHHRKDINGLTLLHFNPGARRLAAGEDDIQWLQGQLQDTRAQGRAVVVVSHAGLDNVGEIPPRRWSCDDGEPPHKVGFPRAGIRLREIIKEAGNVGLVLGGHEHRDSHQCIDGTHYVRLRSLGDRMNPCAAEVTGRYAWLEVGWTGAVLTLHGNDIPEPVTQVLPFTVDAQPS